MNVSTNDPAFVAPVSWSWYVDGVLRSTDEQLQWQGGAQGSQQGITVQGVDANGLSHTGYRTVNVCSGTEITC